jgi:tetratricopeptide (TPR) repeat protein
MAEQSRDAVSADAAYREYIDRFRDDPEGLGAYGAFCLRAGRLGAARYLLFKAARLQPSRIDFLVQLAYAELESGGADDARRVFASVLERFPGHPEASLGIARCHAELGQWREATQAYAVAQAHQPDSVPVLVELAHASQEAGDADRAGDCYRRAERLAPNDLQLQTAYGSFLLAQGSFHDALDKFTRCERLRPGDAMALLGTCRCLYGMGQRDRALELFARIAQIAQDLPDYQEELGDCLNELAECGDRDSHWGIAADQLLRSGNSNRLLPLLEKMLVANPSNATAWNLKGLHHVLAKQVDAAEAAFKRAIEANPSWPDAYANLANLYESANRVAEAKAIAEAAPQLDAAKSELLSDSFVVIELVLARAARRQKNFSLAMLHLARIDQLKRNDEQRERALFERGNMLDQAGDLTGAMSAFTEANALGRARWVTTHPRSNMFVDSVEQLLRLVGSGWARQWRPTGAPPPEIAPVFLAGFPRSGTTLLNQVLGSRDDVCIMEEEPVFSAILNVVRTLPRGYANSIRDFDAIDIEYLRGHYFAAARKHVALDPSKMLVDKMPFHLTQAGLIHRVFPESKFLHAIRHPCDSILSCFMQNFTDNVAMANFFRLKDAVALYARTMDLWEAYQRDLPIPVYGLRYEDLVDDLEGESRKLCEFLQLDWQDTMLQFSTKALDRGRITTPSYHQVSQPIYRESRFRWERYRNQLMPYLPALRPYIVKLGYPDPLA